MKRPQVVMEKEIFKMKEENWKEKEKNKKHVDSHTQLEGGWMLNHFGELFGSSL